MVREQNVVPKESKYFLGNLIGSSVPSRRSTVQHRPVGAVGGYRQNQTISFRLPQSGYLDVQSSYIKYQIQFDATLTSTGFLSSHSLVKRVIVKDGQNNILEDIDQYSFLYHLVRRSMGCQDQNSSRTILYGSFDEDTGGTSGTVTGLGATSLNNQYLILTLDLSGIFGSNIKYLPLEHIENGMFLDIQLQSAKNVVLSNADVGYTVNDVAWVCDIVDFTPEFENQFKQYLQQMPLELYYHSYQNHAGNLANGSLNNSIAISEKASSLKDLYFCIIADANLSATASNSYSFTPLSGNFSVSLQLGNQRIPQFPITTRVEALAELRKSFNVLNDMVMGGLHTIGSYSQATAPSGTSAGSACTFCMGLNLENHLASSVDGTLVMSGKDSKSVAQNMVLQINNGVAWTASQTVYIWTHTDRIYSVDSFGKGVVSY
jgi:hypothetical protein